MTNQFKLTRAERLLIPIVLAFVLWACRQDNSYPDPLQAGWEGSKVCEILENKPSLRVLKCTFPPGVGHERHFHAKHFGYTLKGGTFEITDQEGTRTVDIPDGYSFYNTSIDWHEILNVGDSTAVFLIMEPKS